MSVNLVKNKIYWGRFILLNDFDVVLHFLLGSIRPNQIDLSIIHRVFYNLPNNFIWKWPKQKMTRITLPLDSRHFPNI